MKVVFAGTPEFAAVALRAIAAAGHDLPLVLTQPDRPAGRGMVLHASPVKEAAQSLGLAVFQPATLKDADAQAVLRAVAVDVMVVAAYGLILPQAVLDMPRFGCLNLHASLLPRWRGAAPIQRAIEAGDGETGVCVMQMEAGLDTGPVLLRQATPIGLEDTAGSVHERLAVIGARLAVDALARLPLPALPQADVGVTYARKIEKPEAILDWRLPAAALHRRVCAFNPFPGAQAALAGTLVKIWRSQPLSSQGEPGQVLKADRHGIVVACGEEALRILELQKAGGKRLAAEQFLGGTPLSPGVTFDLPPC